MASIAQISYLGTVDLGYKTMAGKRNSKGKRIAYQEFGSPDNSQALERAVPDLPPDLQDLRRLRIIVWKFRASISKSFWNL